MRWGIIGTGGIAETMADTILHMDGAMVTAVASRSEERARRFAAAHGITRAFSSVEGIAGCDDVDVIYVASSNERHHADATQCLLSGKPVLCEEPLTTDLESAEMLVGTARSTGVFLMEAMWMRFQPFWTRLVDMVHGGAIGRLRHIQADFGIVAEPDPTRRWFDPGQGGGALLDVGIYPVTLACLLAGEPEEVVHLSVDADTGVDAQTGLLMRHRAGVLSVIGSSLVADTGIEASISGSDGRIGLEGPFHACHRMTRWSGRTRVEEIEISATGSGYRREIDEVSDVWRRDCRRALGIPWTTR